MQPTGRGRIDGEFLSGRRRRVRTLRDPVHDLAMGFDLVDEETAEIGGALGSLRSSPSAEELAATRSFNHLDLVGERGLMRTQGAGGFSERGCGSNRHEAPHPLRSLEAGDRRRKRVGQVLRRSRRWATQMAIRLLEEAPPERRQLLALMRAGVADKEVAAASEFQSAELGIEGRFVASDRARRLTDRGTTSEDLESPAASRSASYPVITELKKTFMGQLCGCGVTATTPLAGGGHHRRTRTRSPVTRAGHPRAASW